MRGRIKGVHSTCFQIILSLLERCPLVRVFFKRATTVYGKRYTQTVHYTYIYTERCLYTATVLVHDSSMDTPVVGQHSTCSLQEICIHMLHIFFAGHVPQYISYMQICKGSINCLDNTGFARWQDSHPAHIGLPLPTTGLCTILA